ncbi:uncharacterized protein LOC143027955 [Oratosquilla oratoria]|uniref:uncharacterized protein LOC143027955 n=1 Tax=Oratosquilla oratoria TaxID=337810 RepID=UPI003F7713B1
MLKESVARLCAHLSGLFSEQSGGEAVKKTVLLARQVGSEGFADMEEEEVMDLACGHAVELSEEVVELIQSASEEDNGKEEMKPQEGLTLESLVALMQQASTLKSAIYETDPSMVRATAAQNAIDTYGTLQGSVE